MPELYSAVIDYLLESDFDLEVDDVYGYVIDTCIRSQNRVTDVFSSSLNELDWNKIEESVRKIREETA